jgi:SAM-dependent MidA family methyltransferase
MPAGAGPAAGLRSPSDPSSESSSDRSARLTAAVRAEIDSAPERRVTFARFMERALYEPELGYYMQPADRPTDASDFLTAPETHAIFGWTIARRIELIWAELGRPRPFDIIEYGAGSGTLALSIIEGFRRHDSTDSIDLLEAVRYTSVESSGYRQADLHERFERAGLAELLTVTGSPSNKSVPVTGVILANEFLDALPVHRVVVRGGQMLELFVAWRDGFVEVEVEPSTPDLARRLADDGFAKNDFGREHLVEGQVAEICLGVAPWLDEVSHRLARGYLMVIDYGYEASELYGPRHLAGTLLGYRGHHVVENPFADVGLTDLTAHVDFTAIQVLGERRGLRSVALTTQSEFLVSSGLESELQALQAAPETAAADYLRARSGVVRMLDPRHMGRFRVLTMERQVSDDPLPRQPAAPGIAVASQPGNAVASEP